jgi:uncharacterized delta-60 repeat protein
MRMRKIVILAFVIGMTLGDAARAADGDIDPGFGAEGIAFSGITDGDPMPSGCRPRIQPDGKILICGTRLTNGEHGSDFLVARFNADGTLDQGFGTGGRVTIDFDHGTGADKADGVALQSDGRIVVAGTTYGAMMQSAAFAVARLTADGALDTSFAAGSGQATIDFGSNADARNDPAYSLAIQPDDKIVVAGSTENVNGSAAAVVRLLADGERDGGFGVDGWVTFGFGLAGATAEADNASGVAIDSEGRIVLAGTAHETAPVDEAEFAVARLLADGQPDAAFGNGGRTTIAFDPGSGISTAFAFGIVIARDGKLLVPGYANSAGQAVQNMDMAAARLLEDGSLDATFGAGGKVVLPFDLEPNGIDAALDIAEEAEGRLVFVGTALGDSTQYAAALRLTPAGALDPSFGTLGRETYDFGLTAPGTQAFTGVALQDAQIIASGVAYLAPLGTPQPLDCFVARLSNDSVFAGGFD